MSKSSTQRLMALSLAGALAMISVKSALVRAADPATAPTAAVGTRTPQEINQDIQTQFGNIKELLQDPTTLTDQAKRTAAAPKALPAFKKIVADFSDLEAADPQSKDQVEPAKAEFTMFLSLMGDADATKEINTDVESKDPATALKGKSAQLMIAWLNTNGNEPAGTKVVDQVESLAKENPGSKELTGQMLQMSQMGSPSPALTTRLQGIVNNTMKNELADMIRQQGEAQHKLEAIENKPLIISGKQLDGKDFTTADWKGKVILVDFWATWCGPCRAELPRVEKMYKDYHDKGLEVLGVSNDMSADDLKQFLDQNKEMPWPQLFDANAAGQQQWNPITMNFGINGIPTMFLIDKKGVCRTVSAREKMEDLIPKMLAE